MKIRDFLKMDGTGDKYDMAIRLFYAMFYAAGLIIFVCVGLAYMTVPAWILAFVCSVFGATAYGTITKMIINLSRKDGKVNKSKVLVRLFYVIFFSIATVACLSVGVHENNARTWIIAFVASYGGASIASFLVHIIITLARKDNDKGQTK